MWVSVRLQWSDPWCKTVYLSPEANGGGGSELAPLMYSATMSTVASFIVIHAAWT